MIKKIFQLLGAIFIGLILSIWIIQNNTKIELTIANKIVSELEKSWNVKIDATSSRINLFNFSLYLYDCKIKYLKKDDCYWKFDQCKIHLQPIDFIIKKKINLQFTFDNIYAHSRVTENTPDIITHISSIFSGNESTVPVSLKSIHINNISLDILSNTHSFQALINGSFCMEKIRHAKKQSLPNSWKGDLSIENAEISIDKKIIAQNITTSGHFYKNRENLSWSMQIDNFIKHFIPNPSQSYAIKSIWDNDQKFILINNDIYSLKLSYLDDKIKIQGNLPTNVILNTINFFKSNTPKEIQNISGNCNLDLSWETKTAQLDPSSNVSIDKLKIRNLELEKIIFKIKESNNERITAILDLIYQKEIQALGILKWKWNKSLGKISLINKYPLKSTKQLGITGYEIEPNNFSLNASFDSSFNFTGDYKINISSTSTNKSLKYSGQFEIDKNIVKTKGKTRKGSYELNLSLWPQLSILKWIYQVKEQKIIGLECDDTENKNLIGDISYSLIRSFLTQSTKHLILGKNCIFNVKIDQSDFSNLHGFVALKNGKFYIPESRNLIEKFQTDFEIKIPNKITLNNFYVGCFKGELSSPKISIQIDGDNQLSILHIPLQIKDLLINWKKDLLAIIYGNILIKKEQKYGYKASGKLIAKKSLLKENILSLPENTSFSSPMGGFSFLQDKDFEFDIKLSSEHPIKTKTPTLETNAAINLRILYQKNKNVTHTPQLTGTVKLDNGHIKFLKTKLFIEYGKVQFISNQMNDPIIDLIASNRINKYQITLQATGSLQKPIILLESNPELSEEQILGLLLSGSEAAKLQTDLLAMLEQNLHDMILGNKAISPQATNFFQKLAKPLKYIQISPDFTNQSARGGIKGAVSVNISDQVKAQIQKNFNLQDDFNAQIEYQISDDVNIKGSLDQRGELGAEVELRLKL